MKSSIATVCMAAGICLAGTGYALAADAQPAAGGPEASRHAKRDPVAAMQKRLDSLGRKLNLKPSQQEAWKAYSDAMIKLAQDRAQERAKRLSDGPAKREELSTPDRMEKMAERMRQGADRMSKLAGETRTFYDQLSAEQKTIFDLYTKNAMRGRMMQHRTR